jgi:hypothetical protein
MAQATTITLADVKKALRVTHAYDDDDLTRRLRSAEQECLRYINRTQLPTLPYDYPAELECVSETVSEQVPSSEDPVAPDVVEGIILMVQAGYEGDPQKRDAYRTGAEALWWPYRVELGA